MGGTPVARPDGADEASRRFRRRDHRKRISKTRPRTIATTITIVHVEEPPFDAEWGPVFPGAAATVRLAEAVARWPAASTATTPSVKDPVTVGVQLQEERLRVVHPVGRLV
jgi:hypothetical protein